jgi:hypothetical protein
MLRGSIFCVEKWVLLSLVTKHQSCVWHKIQLPCPASWYLFWLPSWSEGLSPQASQITWFPLLPTMSEVCKLLGSVWKYWGLAPWLHPSVSLLPEESEYPDPRLFDSSAVSILHNGAKRLGRFWKYWVLPLQMASWNVCQWTGWCEVRHSESHDFYSLLPHTGRRTAGQCIKSWVMSLGTASWYGFAAKKD